MVDIRHTVAPPRGRAIVYPVRTALYDSVLYPAGGIAVLSYFQVGLAGRNRVDTNFEGTGGELPSRQYFKAFGLQLALLRRKSDGTPVPDKDVRVFRENSFVQLKISGRDILIAHSSLIPTGVAMTGVAATTATATTIEQWLTGTGAAMDMFPLTVTQGRIQKPLHIGEKETIELSINFPVVIAVPSGTAFYAYVALQGVLFQTV